MSTALHHSIFPEVLPTLRTPKLCLELEELKAQLARKTTAYIEQDELVKGSFASFAEARKASLLADSLEQDLFALRLRIRTHCEMHGCQ